MDTDNRIYSRIFNSCNSFTVQVEVDIRFTLYGGTLDGSNVTATISGASVAVDKGTKFTMYGGTVKGGYAAVNSSGSYGCSGSVQVAGTFILEGGTVSGGKSDNHGGNIYITGTGAMEMNGGKVVDGMAAGAGKSGGNIYVEGKGKLTVTGGQITSLRKGSAAR